MSYDIYLRCPCCKQSTEDWDPTYNLAGIFNAAFKAAGLEKGFRGLNGMSADAAQPFLAAALAWLNDPANLATIEPLLPSNGWGTLEGAQRTVSEMLEAAKIVEGDPIFEVR